MFDEEKTAFMARWANENGATLQLKGECGFGRPCVGIIAGQAWVDFMWMSLEPHADELQDTLREFRMILPEDLYHKHDCVAVLASPYEEPDYDAAAEQLYVWVQWLNANNWRIEIIPRKTFNERGTFGAELEILMGGATMAELRPPE